MREIREWWPRIRFLCDAQGKLGESLNKPRRHPQTTRRYRCRNFPELIGHRLHMAVATDTPGEESKRLGFTWRIAEGDDRRTASQQTLDHRVGLTGREGSKLYPVNRIARRRIGTRAQLELWKGS